MNILPWSFIDREWNRTAVVSAGLHPTIRRGVAQREAKPEEPAQRV